MFFEIGQRLPMPLGDFRLLQLYIKYIDFVTITCEIYFP